MTFRDLAATREAVLRESQSFHAKLPQLLERAELVNRWVVFRDNDVVSVHETEASALAAAEAAFGVTGGFVVDIVQEHRPVPMTAAVMFA